jgi:hypothetical protein
MVKVCGFVQTSQFRDALVHNQDGASREVLPSRNATSYAESMSSGPDDRLIKVSDLDQNSPLHVGDRAKIADVTVAANPDRGAFRKLAAVPAVEPLVKLHSASAHICLRRSGHF